MKKIFYVVIILIACIGLTACDVTTGVESSGSTITTFVLHNGSKIHPIANLSTYEFTVDNVHNIIYNTDSLPYLSYVDSLVPAIIGTAHGYIFNDTVLYNAQNFDTLDFSQPVRIHTTSADGKATRDYTVEVRVHQIDPYQYVWEGLQSEIYTDEATAECLQVLNNRLWLFVQTATETKAFVSNDGNTWTLQTLTGFPIGIDLRSMVKCNNTLCIADAANTLYTSTDGITWLSNVTSGANISRLLFAFDTTLYAIAVTGTTQTLVACSDGATWHNISILPSHFPVSGAGIWVDSTQAGTPRVYVVGGRDVNGMLLNSVWCSENASYWANMASTAGFTPREDVAVVQYDSVLMVFGGRDDSGLVNDVQLVSPDHGISWKAPNAHQRIGTLFAPRYSANVATTADFYLYIVSGRTATGFVKDVWRGRKNMLLFK